MSDSTEEFEEEEGRSGGPPAEEDEGELWLMSYADMMTLLTCFFILMMAFANYDPVGFTEKTKEVAKHFNRDKYKSSRTKLESLQEEVARHPVLNEMYKVSLQDGGLTITFSGSMLFSPGEYKISPDVLPVLDAMIDLIKTKDPNYRIVVEGHADNPDFEGKNDLNSIWVLSSARAAAVVERFQYFGFQPDHLSPIGKANTNILIEDDKADPQNEEDLIRLALNRRVVIKVIEHQDKSKRVKMGLGIYFEDTAQGAK